METELKISPINNVSLYNVMKTNPVMKFGLHPKNCSKGNVKQDTERWEIRRLQPENTEKGCQTCTKISGGAWFNSQGLGQDSIRVMGSKRETGSFHKRALPLSRPQYQEPSNQTRLFSGHIAVCDFCFSLTSLSDSCSSRPANHQSIRLKGSDESALFFSCFFFSFS